MKTMGVVLALLIREYSTLGHNLFDDFDKGFIASRRCLSDVMGLLISSSISTMKQT